MKKFYKKALVYLIAAVLVSPASLANGILSAAKAHAQEPPILIDEGFGSMLGDHPVIPAGWQFDGTSLYSSSNYGKNLPSIKFDSDGDFMTTPMVNKPSSLEFSLTGESITGGSYLEIKALKDNDFIVIDTISDISEFTQPITIPINCDYKQFKFTYHKFGGDIAIDDVVVRGSIADDTQAPVITITLTPKISISNTGYTITVDYDDSVKKEYKINDGEWQNYEDKEIVVEQEGRYLFYAKGTDQNNKVGQAQVYFSIDKTPPIVTGVENGAHYNYPVYPTIGQVHRTIVTLNGKTFVSGTEVAEEGSYIIEALDSAGNKTVVQFIIDKTIPTLELKGNTEIILEQGTEFTDPGAKANDDNDGDLTDKVVALGNVDTNKLGEYSVVYNVSDAAGNKAKEIARIVRVVEKKELANPEFTVTGGTENGQNYIAVEWQGIGGGIEEYELYVNNTLNREVKASSEIKSYKESINVNGYGVFNVLVIAKKGELKSKNTTTKSVEFKEPVKLTSAPASNVIPAAPISVAPQKAQAKVDAPAPVEQKIETPGDEDGKIKSEETSDEVEKINWTPWIVLFVLIILAGAATGGYFYWFNGEEEVESVVRVPKEGKKPKPTVKMTKKSGSNKKPKRW